MPCQLRPNDIYAFALGTEYAPTDTFWMSYSGDSTFAPSSAQALEA